MFSVRPRLNVKLAFSNFSGLKNYFGNRISVGGRPYKVFLFGEAFESVTWRVNRIDGVWASQRKLCELLSFKVGKQENVTSLQSFRDLFKEGEIWIVSLQYRDKMVSKELLSYAIG